MNAVKNVFQGYHFLPSKERVTSENLNIPQTQNYFDTLFKVWASVSESTNMAFHVTSRKCNSVGDIF